MTSLSQTYTRRASLNSKNGMMLLSLLADEGFSRRINIVNNIFVCNKSFTFEQPSSIEEKSWAKTWDNKYAKILRAWRNWANVRIAVRVYLVSEFIRNAPTCMSQCSLLQPRLAGTCEFIVVGEHCCKSFDTSITRSPANVRCKQYVSVYIVLISRVTCQQHQMEPNFLPRTGKENKFSCQYDKQWITPTMLGSCRWYDQMSSLLTTLLNIPKEMLTTILACLSVMSKPTVVVAMYYFIFHLMIHQADAWHKCEYLHMATSVITLHKGHNNWHTDCSNGVSST